MKKAVPPRNDSLHIIWARQRNRPGDWLSLLHNANSPQKLWIIWFAHLLMRKRPGYVNRTIIGRTVTGWQGQAMAGT